jgi:hypothetical protein
MSSARFATSRRASLGLLAGFAAAVAAPTPSPMTARPLTRDDDASLDLTNPDARVRAYLRMRSRLDGKPSYMPYRGTIFGKPEGKAAVALFDVAGFSWSTVTPLGESRYRVDGVEAGYFLDRITGQPLVNWVNPLNDLETTVKHYRSWAHMLVSPAGLEPVRDGPLPAGTQFTASMGEPTIMNGRVWMHEDLIGQFPSPPKESFADPLQYFGPMLTASSLATWSAAVMDLLHPKTPYVPCMLSYQTLGSWRPFMRMGSTPGLISWRMFGAKAASLDGVPKPLRERVLADYPDFLTKLNARP